MLSLVAEANTSEVGAEAQYLLGVVNQRSGNYEEALQNYSRVSVLYGAFDTWIARAQLGRAESFIQLGQTGEAKSTLENLIQNHPNKPEAQEAQELLDSIN